MDARRSLAAPRRVRVSAEIVGRMRALLSHRVSAGLQSPPACSLGRPCAAPARATRSTPHRPGCRPAVDQAVTLAERDRAWLRERLADLRSRWEALQPGLPHSVVHGDAWVGNVVATEDGQVVLLDPERCSAGPPEWEAVP
ncbi:phosphotransferase [Nonomuraea sp. NPDC050310]|uniref:phosphotransferase family protein n=1 Tax=Nonomuraea sp. NPDC050310 TaxID=3154935 RepID=UPI0033C9FE02